MKKIIKLTIKVIILVIISYIIYDNYNLIINKIEYLYMKYLQPDIIQTLYDNEYSKKENYKYVQINENTTIKNKDDAKNAIYTFLDAGWDRYTIKCDADYLNCTNDVKNLVEDNTYLTDLSNFVHPFNTFIQLNTTFTSTGRIILKKENRYTKDEINELNKKVDEIYNKYYDSSKNVKDNIKIFHDYIINNTKYDSSNITGNSNLSSSNAHGVLFKNIGVCSGYADAMSLFLEKMKIKNYRISSNTHVWNLVYIEGDWKHLDLTWDDPVTYDGSDALNYKFFLIPSNELLNKSDQEHSFNKDVYIEAQ